MEIESVDIVVAAAVTPEQRAWLSKTHIPVRCIRFTRPMNKQGATSQLNVPVVCTTALTRSNHMLAASTHCLELNLLSEAACFGGSVYHMLSFQKRVNLTVIDTPIQTMVNGCLREPVVTICAQPALHSRLCPSLAGSAQRCRGQRAAACYVACPLFGAAAPQPSARPTSPA